MKAMKHLVLMRHANAQPAADDRERPLSAAGRSEALDMGRALEELAPSGFHPEWALASPARRAQETLAAVRSRLRSLAGAETDEALYLASPGQLLARLQRVPDETVQLLLVGHNPGMSELAQLLVGEAGAELWLRAARGLAPAACAALRIEGLRWCELTPGCAELVELLTPRRGRRD
jgi:phosphohistidine phosphatase